jgi:hypothetical protein
METIHGSQEALLLEALSDKVLHQLPPAVWKELFLGAGRASIRFEQRELTLVHADAVPAGEPGGATESFYQELQRISARHGGRLDPYVNATALASFDDPGAAVRMATELQHVAQGVALRIGVVSGVCTLALFRAQGRLWCTPLGSQPALAAEVAALARVGGMLICPGQAKPVDIEIGHGDFSETRPDFLDSEPDLSSLGCVEEAVEIDIHC